MSRTIALITIVLIAVFVLSACGSSAAKLNNQGNDSYVQQAYEEALASYQSAQRRNPDLAEPHYNAANTLYRQGDYTGALQELQKALALVTDLEQEPHIAVSQASYFNTGNNRFNTQELEAAIDAYRQALLLNPYDLDAKYNLELALQQQQQQDEQNQQQESRESEDQQNEQQQDASESQDPSENSDGGDQDQDKSDNESQEGEGQEQQQEGQSQNSDQQEGDPNQDQQQKADQQAGQSQPQSGQEDPTKQPSYAPAPGERMSQEQARQLLAAIAGNSDTLMERLNQMLYVNMEPPAQDW